MPDKLLFIEEQMIQLDVAKRLLKKIESKEGMNIYDAMNSSFEEDHLDFYKKNLSNSQLKLDEDMLASPDSMSDHEQMVYYLKAFSRNLKKNDMTKSKESVNAIKNNFKKYNPSHHTITLLMKSFLEACLEGPISQRILTTKEVVHFINHLESN